MRHTHSHTHTCTGSWHIELYLTPSNLVYSTAGVLCALAVGIAIIISLLQAREKVTRSRQSLLFGFESDGLRKRGREKEGEGGTFIEKLSIGTKRGRVRGRLRDCTCTIVTVFFPLHCSIKIPKKRSRPNIDFTSMQCRIKFITIML